MEPVSALRGDLSLSRVSPTGSFPDDCGLADGASILDRGVGRDDAWPLARTVRNPEGLHSSGRRNGGGGQFLRIARQVGISGLSFLGGGIHRGVRLGVSIALVSALSACALVPDAQQSGQEEKPVTVVPQTIRYYTQPKLGEAWNYGASENAMLLAHEEPALVLPKTVAVSPEKSVSAPLPQPPKAPILPGSETIPLKVSPELHNRKKMPAKTDWRCHPVKIPCGKAGAAYWECIHKPKKVGEK